MARDGQNKRGPEGQHHQRCVDFEELVRIIGYQLTASIGSTDTRTVALWLHEGVPVTLQPRMQAALDIAKPIERVESELVAQGRCTVSHRTVVLPRCCVLLMCGPPAQFSASE